ncbi:MAG TPA: hypothetical protein PK867_12620, partial [Pirellulales bacterium]|nr:hypothetical protein [Pirellulales bacterium]
MADSTVGFVYIRVLQGEMAPPTILDLTRGTRELPQSKTAAILLVTDEGSGWHWQLRSNCPWWPAQYRSGTWRYGSDPQPAPAVPDAPSGNSVAQGGRALYYQVATAQQRAEQAAQIAISGFPHDFLQAYSNGMPVFQIRGLDFSCLDLRPSPFHTFSWCSCQTPSGDRTLLSGRVTFGTFPITPGTWSYVMTGMLLAEVKRDLATALQEAIELEQELGINIAAALDPDPISGSFLSLYAADLASKRGDYLGCGMNLLAVVPLLGELAKAARAAAATAMYERLVARLEELVAVVKQYSAIGKQTGELKGISAELQGTTAVHAEEVATHDLAAGPVVMDRYT